MQRAFAIIKAVISIAVKGAAESLSPPSDVDNRGVGIEDGAVDWASALPVTSPELAGLEVAVKLRSYRD